MFRQKWNKNILIAGLGAQYRQYQVALLKTYNGFHFDIPKNERTIEEILKKIEEFLVGEVNETYE